MIRALEVTGEANITDVFTAFRRVSRGNLIFWEDGSKWTFGNARTTVNAGIRVNVNPRPFINRLTRNHTLYGTNINATTVANA
jgi:hypothetical protein